MIIQGHMAATMRNQYLSIGYNTDPDQLAAEHSPDQIGIQLIFLKSYISKKTLVLESKEILQYGNSYETHNTFSRIYFQLRKKKKKKNLDHHTQCTIVTLG